MSFSRTIEAQLPCPSCAMPLSGTFWVLIDLGERPDLLLLLETGDLNTLRCPHCHAHSTAPVALLVHDPVGRRVYFAIPPDTAEHVAREQAQSLLLEWLAARREEAPHPSMADLRVAQDVAGIQRAIERHSRRRNARRSAEPPAAAADPSTALLEGVAALLAADTAEELAAAARPLLNMPDADRLLSQLAEQARLAGETTTARAIAEARPLLARLRAGEPLDTPPAIRPAGHELSSHALQAALRALSPAALHDAVRNHPVLLEPWADETLADLVDTALDEGNERLAAEIELRREALAALHRELMAPPALAAAAAMLLQTRNEEAITTLLDTYPALLTEPARMVLWQLGLAAAAADDLPTSQYARELHAMLQQVRIGLEEPAS